MSTGWKNRSNRVLLYDHLLRYVIIIRSTFHGPSIRGTIALRWGLEVLMIDWICWQCWMIPERYLPFSPEKIPKSKKKLPSKWKWLRLDEHYYSTVIAHKNKTSIFTPKRLFLETANLLLLQICWIKTGRTEHERVTQLFRNISNNTRFL